MLNRPDLLLRVESFVLMILSSTCYLVEFHGGTLLWMCVMFLPEISLLGVLSRNKKFASGIYNLFHWYAVPVVLGFIAFRLHWHVRIVLEIATVWVFNISFMRTLGMGLKYAQAYATTHLQNVRFLQSR